MLCRRVRFGHLQLTPSCRLVSSGISSPETSSLDVNVNTKNRHDTPFVIFDTAKNSKCKLSTRRRNVLTWYSCGPTVYDSAHIGHASSFIRQDIIRRILESLDNNLAIIQVMGITDIDDKIINKANQSGREWKAISKHYEQEFVEDLSKLNVTHPHIFTRVSNHIPEIQQFVGNLVKMGLAYPTSDGSVYFDTEKYGNKYGIFRQASSEEEDEEQGTEKEFTKEKKNSKDFAVWKGAKPGEPYWSSPCGSANGGRPGWHIECSVMASKIFGASLDLHTGGQDLIFPHHENEEAQCCAHFGSEQWTSHWLHMGHLHFKGDVKMSKSLGNTVSISSFLENYSPDVLRLMCILSKYRRNLEYSPDSVDIAKKILKKFHTFLNDSSAIVNGSKPVKTAEDDTSFWMRLENAKVQLTTALKNDFDTPEALKIIIEFMSDFNRQHLPVDSSSKTLNSYVNYEVVLASKLFVQEFLSLVGFQSVSTQKKSILQQGSCLDNMSAATFENLIDHFVTFRNEVRSFSLAMDETDKDARKRKINERKELLKACDNVRNQLLDVNQVEIKDHGKNSSWSFVDSGAKPS